MAEPVAPPKPKALQPKLPPKPAAAIAAATPTPPAKPVAPPKKKANASAKQIARVVLQDLRVKSFVVEETTTAEELRGLVEAKLLKEVMEGQNPPDFSKLTLIAWESANDKQWVRQTAIAPNTPIMEMMSKFPDSKCTETNCFMFKQLQMIPVRVVFEDKTFKTYPMNECSVVADLKHKALGTWSKNAKMIPTSYLIFEHVDEGAGVWESPLEDTINVYERVKSWPQTGERDAHHFVYKSPHAVSVATSDTGAAKSTGESGGNDAGLAIAPKKIIPGAGMNLQMMLMKEAASKKLATGDEPQPVMRLKPVALKPTDGPASPVSPRLNHATPGHATPTESPQAETGNPFHVKLKSVARPADLAVADKPAPEKPASAGTGAAATTAAPKQLPTGSPKPVRAQPVQPPHSPAQEGGIHVQLKHVETGEVHPQAPPKAVEAAQPRPQPQPHSPQPQPQPQPHSPQPQPQHQPGRGLPTPGAKSAPQRPQRPKTEAELQSHPLEPTAPAGSPASPPPAAMSPTLPYSAMPTSPPPAAALPPPAAIPPPATMPPPATTPPPAAMPTPPAKPAAALPPPAGSLPADSLPAGAYPPAGVYPPGWPPGAPFPPGFYGWPPGMAPPGVAPAGMPPGAVPGAGAFPGWPGFPPGAFPGAPAAAPGAPPAAVAQPGTAPPGYPAGYPGYFGFMGFPPGMFPGGAYPPGTVPPAAGAPAPYVTLPPPPAFDLPPMDAPPLANAEPTHQNSFSGFMKTAPTDRAAGRKSGFLNRQMMTFQATPPDIPPPC
eukprot:TRINITY_DN385_c3_g1_i1.p1 TRINITY_DN385_c3_g1~~TRINITY_DN385_c3_g1_i1.p1  ORF type:complete len:811 (+),score=148.03 TRINITY_DN385_c3_g1_i1:108-2435(+)